MRLCGGKPIGVLRDARPRDRPTYVLRLVKRLWVFIRLAGTAACSRLSSLDVDQRCSGLPVFDLCDRNSAIVELMAT